MKRIVTHDTTLGAHDKNFKLSKGEEFETFETDVYGRIRTVIQGVEVSFFIVTLERFSNEA